MYVALVRQRLAAAAATVVLPAGLPKLQTFGYVPADIDPPCFYAGEAEYNPLTDFGATDTVTITCRVLTSTVDDEAGQLLLDQLLRRTGPTSVRAALERARGAPGQHALDGACDDFVVTRIAGYRLYRVADRAHFGAEITVKAVGDGTED
ncbi:hypothetical protein ABT297_04060 [Dactylosporangium sp. NPDC000555]|uniref:hypothetical protein n=1 Tax=Dactylosporangium sp. NPDC000555 TaxID=3154260 RepID=UPI003322C37B